MGIRHDGREPDELRPVTFTRDFTELAMGSVLVEVGRTRVLCTASVEERVPPWLRGKGRGWVTAEYSMLPGSTPERVNREAAKGKQSGRTQEIQRLIGRSLRAVTDLVALGEVQITVDCDALQADGGTRTASICGGYLALHDADLPQAPLHRRRRFGFVTGSRGIDTSGVSAIATIPRTWKRCMGRHSLEPHPAF